MFAHQNRREFADTCTAVHDLVVALPGISQLETVDAQEQLAQADDNLLRLVMCVSCATLTLALVSSLA